MDEEIFTKGIRHTAHGLNFYMSLFDEVARVLPREELCFIVGGWVRDRVLGEPVGEKIDIDLLTTYDPIKLARALAERIGGAFFEFEKRKLFWRSRVGVVVLKQKPYTYRFDIAQIRGNDIEKALIQDLLSRDFSANAMAINMDHVLSLGARQTFIYDPCHGMEDLEMGILKPVSLSNIEEDPIRILRGFRIAHQRKLELTEDFLDFVRRKSNIIKKSPPERITQELLRIFSAENSWRVIKDLYEIGILKEIFPETARWEEVKDKSQEAPLSEHIFKVIKELEEIIKRKNQLLPDGIEIEREFLGEFSQIELTKLAALLHDIAKPHTYKVIDGKSTFYGHDVLGEQMVRNYAKVYKWGKDVEDFVAKMVRHHLRLFFLREAKLKNELTDRAKYRFWRDCEDIAPYLFLHSLADSIASDDSETQIQALIELFKELWEFKLKMGQLPSALLSGDEIMDILKIEQGPEVGKLKQALIEAQIEGKVKTKEEAIEFLKQIKYRDG
ncbi:MAG: HD domain-containing protein [Aquificaceae bacterium]